MNLHIHTLNIHFDMHTLSTYQYLNKTICSAQFVVRVRGIYMYGFAYTYLQNTGLGYNFLNSYKYLNNTICSVE